MGSQVDRPIDQGILFCRNLAFIGNGRNEEEDPIASVLREDWEILGVEGFGESKGMRHVTAAQLCREGLLGCGSS
ncbi:hypothetical protein GT039_17550 [Streptomyces sp. SID2955]|nr:hypothetical protein [Streptomyces sp. SID2955]